MANKTVKMGWAKGLAGVVLSLLFSACSGTGADTPFCYQDLIAEFGVFERILPVQTENLIFADSNTLPYGWSASPDGATHRWAEGLESAICFTTIGQTDVILSMRCAPFMPDATYRQSMKIDLNDEEIGSILFENTQERHHQILLPARSVRSGMNLLIFRYGYALKPSDSSNSNDTRNLSVSFTNISLKADSGAAPSPPILRQNGGTISQSKETQMGYYYRIPKDSYLSVGVGEMAEGTIAAVDIIPETGDSKSVSVKRPGKTAIPLKAFEGRVARLLFSVKDWDGKGIKTKDKSAENGVPGTVSWTEIKVFKEKDGTKHDEPPLNADLSRFREEIRGLDVIYIIFDAFTAGHSSLYGYDRNTTPFLDRLARKAMVFENVFANHPYTLASTGTLLTSKYSYEHGCIKNETRLSPICPTLPELLSPQGIESYLIAENKFLNGPWGLQRGFKKVYFNEYYKDDLGKVTDAFIDIYAGEAGEKRKFIYVHLIPPHEPYTPPAKFRVFHHPDHTPISTDAETLTKISSGEIRVTQRQLDHIIATYDAYVLFADAIAEHIMEFLENRGIRKRSIVFITSDHGEAFREHGAMTHNSTLYDEMVHIPFIMVLPDHIRLPASRISGLTSVIDMAPTIADIFGISGDMGFNGASILPMLFGDKGRDAVYLETLLAGHRGIRDLTHKYIETPSGSALYDLARDPRETRKVVDHRSITAGRLMQRFAFFRNSGSDFAPSVGNVDLNALDADTIRQLKELGYIK